MVFPGRVGGRRRASQERREPMAKRSGVRLCDQGPRPPIRRGPGQQQVGPLGPRAQAMLSSAGEPQALGLRLGNVAKHERGGLLPPGTVLTKVSSHKGRGDRLLNPSDRREIPNLAAKRIFHAPGHPMAMTSVDDRRSHASGRVAEPQPLHVLGRELALGKATWPPATPNHSGPVSRDRERRARRRNHHTPDFPGLNYLD